MFGLFRKEWTLMSAETEQQHRADTRFNGVENPRYIFYGIPINEEGELFMNLCRKYLNKKVYTYKRRWRGKGSYQHSCPPSLADSFVIYIDEKGKIY